MGTILAALKAVAAFFGFGEKVAAEIHDSNQRTAGADHVTATDNKERADAERKASQALVDTDRDSAVKQLRGGSA